MATALQIAIAQGLDINDIEGGAAKVAALAAEAEREAMVLKAKGVDVFFRRCDTCGSAIWYPSIAVQLAYVFCHVCGRQMLANADLRGYLPPVPVRESCVVVSAQYGHITDASRRIDVSQVLTEKAQQTGGRSIEVGVTEDLRQLFTDPLPGIPKILELKVRMYDRVYKTMWEEYRNLPAAPIRVVADEHRPSGELSPDSYKIQVIVAIIGPPKNPLQAGDITSFIRYRLRETDGKRLYIPDDENLELEVDDPSPGNPKVLLLRYSIFNRRGYVKINLIERPGRAGFYLERTLDITASPTVPALVITGANFGHPAASTRSYDATEIIQARVDQAGGEWLNMLPTEDVHDLLGDPYVGSTKTLQIHYHLKSKVASLAVRERHSRLEVPVHIVAPIVAPRIMITSAKFVFDSYTLGGPVRPPEDVAPTIRRLIDEAGGARLEIATTTDVLALFGFSGENTALHDTASTRSLTHAGSGFGASSPAHSTRRPGGRASTAAGELDIEGLSHVSEVDSEGASTARSTARGSASGAGEAGSGVGGTAAGASGSASGSAALLSGLVGRRGSAPGEPAEEPEGKQATTLGGQLFRKNADGSWEATGAVIPGATLAAAPGHDHSGGGSSAPTSATGGRAATSASAGGGGGGGRASVGAASAPVATTHTPAAAATAGAVGGATVRSRGGYSEGKGEEGAVAAATVAGGGRRSSGKRSFKLGGPRRAAVRAGSSRLTMGSAMTTGAMTYQKPVNHRLIIEYVDRGKRNYLQIVAKERRGVAHLVSPIKLFSDLPKQAITVLGAAYGHPTDGGKRVDVREKLQQRVVWHREGSRLDVDRDTNVDEVFGNPCKGVFKVLILRYATAEVKGVYRIHVPGPGAPLGQNLRIGWMPGT